jgi:hypothetical protein
MAVVSVYAKLNRAKYNKKSYESRNNKVLVHEKCKLVLHKNSLCQDSYFWCISVPKKSIIS